MSFCYGCEQSFFKVIPFIQFQSQRSSYFHSFGPHSYQLDKVRNTSSQTRGQNKGKGQTIHPL